MKRETMTERRKGVRTRQCVSSSTNHDFVLEVSYLSLIPMHQDIDEARRLVLFASASCEGVILTSKGIRFDKNGHISVTCDGCNGKQSERRGQASSSFGLFRSLVVCPSGDEKQRGDATEKVDMCIIQSEGEEEDKKSEGPTTWRRRKDTHKPMRLSDCSRYGLSGFLYFAL